MTATTNERVCGLLKIVDALREELGAAEVRLGIEALVVRPRREVAAGDAQHRAAEAERRRTHALVERVGGRSSRNFTKLPSSTNCDCTELALPPMPLNQLCHSRESA